MSKWWSYIVTVMVMFSLGMVHAPRLCAGDGQGGACHMEACACVTACSCQGAHEQERAAAEQIAPTESEADGLEACCLVGAEASCPNKASASSACHGPNQFPHFSLPARQWMGVPGGYTDLTAFLAPIAEPATWAPHRAPPLPQSPLEKPPRVMAAV